MNAHRPLPPARANAGRRILNLTAGVVIAVLLAGCGSQAATTGGGPPAPHVSVARVLSKQVSLWDEYTGRVAAVESVELRPRVSGYIERVVYDEGGRVHEGDLLFVIDQRRYRAEVERVEAELDRASSAAQLAETQLARARKLVADRTISREDLDTRRAAAAQAGAAVRAAEAAVATARLDLAFTEVRAPIDGVAGRALVTTGNLARANSTLLTTVVSQDPVHVHFAIDEQSALRYGPPARDEGNIPVRVALANEQDYPHEGTLDFMDNHVDPDTGTIHARALLPNPDGVFTPGLFARVQLRADTGVPALLVEETAVLTDQDRKYVYVLGPGNEAVRKDVGLGRKVDGLQMVTSGLSARDRVIVGGVQKVLFPGMPVVPKFAAMGGEPGLEQVASVEPTAASR